MLKLGSTYLIVKNMQKSIDFYEKLLDMKVTSQNYTRWAQFNFHNSCIALWNPEYDKQYIESGNSLEGIYSKNYINYQKETQINYGNNVVLNFYIDDLEAEYQRLKAADIGTLTPIMYLNVAMPYYLFVIEDPDGNQIEITGNYDKVVE